MSKSRRSLAALIAAAAALIPASGASATADIADTVHEITIEAADLVAREHALLASGRPEIDLPAADLAEIQAALRIVDARGAAALEQLDRLDVELTNAIRVALDRLPPPPRLDDDQLGTRPPPAVVYEAAMVDLLRIADDPDAVLPGRASNRGPALGLLVVAAIALLMLGTIALASTIRRHPDGDDLAAMAWSDGLTGLANRRRLDHDISSGGGCSDATAVIMVDVDHFKSVNDSFGHQVGDQVLRTIATMLANQIRFDDVVYRYGGEEFCIVLPDTSTSDARRVADRIVRAARQIELPDGQHITVSVGVAASAHGDVVSAVKSADFALFEAKDLGRDQAVTADEGEFVGS